MHRQLIMVLGAKDRRVGGDSGPPDVQNFEGY